MQTGFPRRPSIFSMRRDPPPGNAGIAR